MSSLSNKNEPQSLPPDASAGSGVQGNVNTHFDATVSYWDEVYSDQDLQGVIYQQRQTAVLEYVDTAELPEPARVLEIGCGAGHLTVRLAERKLQVNAIDASAGMVELTARQEKPYLTDKVVGLVCWADGGQAMQGINAMDAVAKALRAWVIPYSVPLVKNSLYTDAHRREFSAEHTRKLDRLIALLGNARQSLTM